jgi:hypothetical protein
MASSEDFCYDLFAYRFILAACPICAVGKLTVISEAQKPHRTVTDRDLMQKNYSGKAGLGFNTTPQIAANNNHWIVLIRASKNVTSNKLNTVQAMNATI